MEKKWDTLIPADLKRLFSTEERYFKVDDSMEKKWDTLIPADLKRLFLSGTYVSRWSRKG